MTGESDLPVGLYVAAYSDSDAARADWADIHELACKEVITVEALVLIRRDCDGKIHEEETADDVPAGNVLGAAGGLLTGIVFPPAMVASRPYAGGLVSHDEKKEIKAEVANDLPAASSGIVVLVEGRWAAKAVEALSRSDFLSTHRVDRRSVEHAKTEFQALNPNP